VLGVFSLKLSGNQHLLMPNVQVETLWKMWDEDLEL